MQIERIILHLLYLLLQRQKGAQYSSLSSRIGNKTIQILFYCLSITHLHIHTNEIETQTQVIND